MKLIPSIAMPIWAAKLKVIISRCESCHKLLALRHLSARKAGIRMLGNWYCSSRCFRSAAEQEVLRLLKPGMEQVAHVSRMPLGLNLISRGLLTIEQLRRDRRTPRAPGLRQRKAGNCHPRRRMGVSGFYRTQACDPN
jgi:hypothetical protein